MSWTWICTRDIYIYTYTNRYGIVSARCFFNCVALRHVAWHYCIIIMPCHFFKYKFIGRFDTHTHKHNTYTHTTCVHTHKHIQYMCICICMCMCICIRICICICIWFELYMFDVSCILYNVHIYIYTYTPFGNQRWQWKILRQDRCGTEASPSES